MTYKYGSEPHEQLVIGLARDRGAAKITIPYTNGLTGEVTSVAFCGKCGRVVCHPDCPRISPPQYRDYNPDKRPDLKPGDTVTVRRLNWWQRTIKRITGRHRA